MYPCTKKSQRKLIYGFLYFEGMEGQVQQFVTLRFGDLWLNVPIGPIVTSLSESWKTTAASLVVPDQEEITSPPMEGFTPVLSKSAKRKMRAARKRVAQSSARRSCFKRNEAWVRI